MIPRRTILEALTREALLEITGLSGQRKEAIVEELAATRSTIPSWAFLTQ